MMYRFFDHMGGYWPHSYFNSWGFMSPWGIVLGALAIIAVVVLVIVLVKVLKKKPAGSGNEEVLELLKTKYVSGEITEEEYLKKKKTLSK